MKKITDRKIIKMLLDRGDFFLFLNAYERLSESQPFLTLTSCPRMDIDRILWALEKMHTYSAGHNQIKIDYLGNASVLENLAPVRKVETPEDLLDLKIKTNSLVTFFGTQGAPYIHAMPILIAWVKYLLPKQTEARGEVVRLLQSLYFENIAYKRSKIGTSSAFTSGLFGEYFENRRNVKSVADLSLEEIVRAKEKENADAKQAKAMAPYKAAAERRKEEARIAEQENHEWALTHKTERLPITMMAKDAVNEALLDECMTLFPTLVSDFYSKIGKYVNETMCISASILLAGGDLPIPTPVGGSPDIAWSTKPIFKQMQKQIATSSKLLGSHPKVAEVLTWNVLHHTLHLYYKAYTEKAEPDLPKPNTYVTQRFSKKKNKNEYTIAGLQMDMTSDYNAEALRSNVKSLEVSKMSLGLYQAVVYRLTTKSGRC